MYVIGTAGHVDHGKSTLVEALTGINPDRLKEERERQMTIDLGFAWLRLGDDEVGVVDVPGHRDFIENMLAGVGGIDAALLVVAADEGPMPQTREHVAILDLLQVPAGVVALTKSDLVEAEWTDLVQAELAGLLARTTLAGAPVVPVSARTGHGLEALRAALRETLQRRSPRPDLGRPRLPIDRAFSVAGFGTIVTGTLAGGSLSVGDEVVLLPVGLGARIRGLQTHKTRRELALPGSRVAVNLAGVEFDQVRRGQVLARPGSFAPTTLLDARLRHLPDAGLPLKHNAEVKFFVGATEVVGRLRLLDRGAGEALPPGAAGWVQLALEAPVVVARGDRFILRRPSPAETIAGGDVIDPHPRRRHRRQDAAVLVRLETLARGTPGEVLAQALDSLGPASLAQAAQRAGLKPEAAAEALAEARETGLVVELDGEQLAVSRGVWGRLEAATAGALATYHAAYPLRQGMPREELKSRVLQAAEPSWRDRLTPRALNAVVARVVQTGAAAATGSTLRLPRHAVTFPAAQQALVDRLLDDLKRDPHNTPSRKDLAARLGDELLNALLEQGALVAASAEVVFDAPTYRQMVERVRAHLQAQGTITVAQVRDMFATSRKYALALMEHLDAIGVTRRTGDERVLKNP